MNFNEDSGFDIEFLKSIPSRGSRYRYAQQFLTHLGEGSSRAAFAISDSKVLKLAINDRGEAQNRAEVRFGQKQHGIVANQIQRTGSGFNICTEILGFGSLYEYVIAERASSFNDSSTDNLKEFLHLTGIESLIHLYDLLYDVECDGTHDNVEQVQVSDTIVYMKKLPWVQALVRFVVQNGYSLPGDFSRISSYGSIIRKGKQNIILVDYGFTPSVSMMY